MDEFLTDKQVASIFKLTRPSIWRLVKEGRIPQPVKIAANSTRWRKSDIDKFIATAQ